jgi:hypothetical protein
MAAEFWVGPVGAPDTYGLVSMLGGGGEGEVWEAVLPLSEGGRRTVAVKILKAFGDDGEAEHWNRFGHLLRSLAHPGLVRVTDVFTGPGMHRAGDDGTGTFRYVVMDYIEGDPLHEWLAEHPETTVSQRLRMLRMIASALDAMHSGATTEIAVAHGDVKPANIVVGADRGAVLVDLGLTRLTDAAGVSGHSAPYAAPEVRTLGALATPEADRYAFAVTTAQVLTATPPPLGPDGWLDVPALNTLLREHPPTARRHALIQRLLAALTAPPDARPQELREWLDGMVESLSQITGPAAQDSTTVPDAGSGGDRSALPTFVPGGPMSPIDPRPLPVSADAPARAPGRDAVPAQPIDIAIRRRSQRGKIIIALGVLLLTMIGAGTAFALRGQPADTTSPIAASPGTFDGATPMPGPSATAPPVPAIPVPAMPMADASGGSAYGGPAGSSQGGSSGPPSGGTGGGDTPAPAPCSYSDAGNGQPITATRGSTFTDSRGMKYRVEQDCELKLLSSPKPADCSYSDAGNGRPITAKPGSTFTDSRGMKYRVEQDCELKLLSSPKPADCSYSDAGNGRPITAKPGSTFTDSRGMKYRVEQDCGLTPLPGPNCTFSDAGDGHPITASRGSTFTDSLGNTYRVGDDCELERV